MDSYAIEASGVSRSFAGAKVVRNLSLKVRRGAIYGLLGRNGAGKTTVIKMLAGLIWPDEGAIRVNGAEPMRFTVEDRWKIGYVSERQVLNPHMRVGALIKFTSNFYPEWDDSVCERILKRFKIDPSKRVSELSLGMARQAAFMLALAQKPDLLILDEPAANLDAVARREFLDELLDLLRQGEKTVLISSHILSDIERVAEDIGILSGGELKISEPLDRLKDTVKKVRFHGLPPGGGAFAIPGALNIRKSGSEALVVLRMERGDEAAAAAARHGCSFEVMDLNLEDIFVEAVREQED